MLARTAGHRLFANAHDDALGGRCRVLLRASPAADGQVVTALFDAIVALLSGKERRQ